VEVHGGTGPRLDGVLDLQALAACPGHPPKEREALSSYAVVYGVRVGVGFHALSVRGFRGLARRLAPQLALVRFPAGLLELREGEVRRICLPPTSLNKGKRKGRGC